MNLNITFKNFESSDSLKQFIQDKFKKIQKYFNKPLDVQVVLVKEKINHIVDVTLSAKGFHFQVSESSEDMYSALDMVLDSVERRLKKQKDKLKDVKHREASSASEFSTLILNEDAPSQIRFKKTKKEAEPRVIKNEDYLYKIMSLIEAKEHLEESHADFLLFNEEKTKLLFILRKLAQDLDLLEPRYRLSAKEKNEIEKKAVVKLNRSYVVKSCTVDEAIDQIEQDEHSIAVFNNPVSDTLNVLYKKEYGVYGLIETQQ